MQALNALCLHLRWLLPVGLQALQVATSAEVRPLAGDHHAAHLRAAFRHVKGFNTGGVNVGVERVAVVGVADGQHHGLAVAVALEAGGHRSILFLHQAQAEGATAAQPR